MKTISWAPPEAASEVGLASSDEVLLSTRSGAAGAATLGPDPGPCTFACTFDWATVGRSATVLLVSATGPFSAAATAAWSEAMSCAPWVAAATVTAAAASYIMRGSSSMMPLRRERGAGIRVELDPIARLRLNQPAPMSDIQLSLAATTRCRHNLSAFVVHSIGGLEAIAARSTGGDATAPAARGSSDS